MKLVNAGIKSKRELATRLMDGEVFWTKGGEKIHFLEEGYSRTDVNPFRFEEVSLNGCWNEYETFKKEVLWYKNIEKPVLCYVNDTSETDKSCVRIVEGYDENQSLPYLTRNNVYWKYATPISQEEVNQWVLG